MARGLFASSDYKAARRAFFAPSVSAVTELGRLERFDPLECALHPEGALEHARVRCDADEPKQAYAGQEQLLAAVIDALCKTALSSNLRTGGRA